MKNHIENLLINANEFLIQSISDVESKTKFSIIHFYASLELIVKARLMHEHWTLILKKPEQGNIRKFCMGDFNSVSLTEGTDRLKRIVGDEISDCALSKFKNVRDVRNKLVHFYHAEIQKDNKALNEVVQVQFHAMMELDIIIKEKWGVIFQQYTSVNFEIDQKLKFHKQYLETKFKSIQKKIDARVEQGVIFTNCPVCGYKSLETTLEFQDDNADLYTGECLTCSCYDCAIVSFDCPSCGKKIHSNNGYGTCPHCSTNYYPSDLIRIIDTGWDFRIHDGDFGRACCSECEGTDTVIEWEGQLICLSCFTLFDEDCLDQCEYCSSYCTTSLEDSYIYGCVVCDGKYGGDYE